MNFSTLQRAAILLAVLATIAGKASAQGGVIVFKNFKRYPPGKWTITGQGSVDGHLSAPQTSTSCADPTKVPSVPQITKLANDVAPTCQMKSLADTERTVEYEQVCTFGPQRQVTHIIMHAVDDQTINTETHSHVVGGPEMVMHVTSRYGGACSAADIAASKPDAKTCSQLPTMRSQAEAAISTCSQLPAAYHADCVARVQGSVRMVDNMAKACK